MAHFCQQVSFNIINTENVEGVKAQGKQVSKHVPVVSESVGKADKVQLTEEKEDVEYLAQHAFPEFDICPAGITC